jgi:hypothetical protein
MVRRTASETQTRLLAYGVLVADGYLHLDLLSNRKHYVEGDETTAWRTCTWLANIKTSATPRGVALAARVAFLQRQDEWTSKYWYPQSQTRVTKKSRYHRMRLQKESLLAVR